MKSLSSGVVPGVTPELCTRWREAEAAAANSSLAPHQVVKANRALGSSVVAVAASYVLHAHSLSLLTASSAFRSMPASCCQRTPPQEWWMAPVHVGRVSSHRPPPYSFCTQVRRSPLVEKLVAKRAQAPLPIMPRDSQSCTTTDCVRRGQSQDATSQKPTGAQSRAAARRRRVADCDTAPCVCSPGVAGSARALLAVQREARGAGANFLIPARYWNPGSKPTVLYPAEICRTAT